MPCCPLQTQERQSIALELLRATITRFDRYSHAGYAIGYLTRRAQRARCARPDAAVMPWPVTWVSRASPGARWRQCLLRMPCWRRSGERGPRGAGGSLLVVPGCLHARMCVMSVRHCSTTQDVAAPPPSKRVSRRETHPLTLILIDRLKSGFAKNKNERIEDRFARCLKVAHNAPLDRRALDLVLLMAEKAENRSFRARLRFAVRMLQKARRDRLRILARHAKEGRKKFQGERLPQIYSNSLRRLYKLAEPLRKVNVILAIKRYIEQQEGKSLDADAYHLLIGHFAACDRLDLVEIGLHEALRACRTVSAASFALILRNFLNRQAKDRNHDAAEHVWKMLRAPPFSECVKLDADLIRCGAWVFCFRDVDDADEANWIADKFRELRVPPHIDTLHVLVSALIRGGNFNAACMQMLHMIRLEYKVECKQMYEYMGACMRRERPEELVRLAHVLMNFKRRRSQNDEKAAVVRAYLETLYRAGLQDRLDVHPAASCAQRVFTFHQMNDNRSASFVVYLLARAGKLDPANFDAALRLADEMHRKRCPAAERVLFTHAYEALLERCIHLGRQESILTLAMVNGESGAQDDAAAEVLRLVGLKLMYAASKLGRLDFCTFLYNTWCASPTTRSPDVPSAYMYVLALASRPQEALKVFRKLQARHGTSLDSRMTYIPLALVVLKNGTNGSLSREVVAEMMGYIEAHLSRRPDQDATLPRHDQAVESGGIETSASAVSLGAIDAEAERDDKKLRKFVNDIQAFLASAESP
ncbi:hypothetical protein FVE85_7675 [Porphyridium purpureum]|uniref:Uncharacterized protein n=1 Tax=Porphyridium purpureum TaxID=35688 RepID=A0A5J4ZAD8_PORPP|nr:hypothetical protein FVE85_7675 [Porphyridium purpureum]|eukprot:POR4330..scf295_1